MTTQIMVINTSDEILASFHKILAADQYEVIAQVYSDADLREIQRFQPDLIMFMLVRKGAVGNICNCFEWKTVLP